MDLIRDLGDTLCTRALWVLERSGNLPCKNTAENLTGIRLEATGKKIKIKIKEGAVNTGGMCTPVHTDGLEMSQISHGQSGPLIPKS